MEYYSIWFFLLLWLQDEFKGFIATLLCLSMTLGSAVVAPFLRVKFGIDFFESILLVDLFFFIISFFIIYSYIGWILMGVTTLSIILNMIPLIITTPENYELFSQVYPWINIFLFEVLLWGCISTTVVYPWIKEKSKELKHRYSKCWKQS